MRILLVPSLAALAALFAAPAGAIVIGGAVEAASGPGGFVRLTADTPFAVGADTFEDGNLYAFDEDQNIVLDRPLEVEIGPPVGAIPAGSVVASHYVFFDPPIWGAAQRGWVEFDAPIIGVATSLAAMAASDHLANTRVRYLNPALRGLEWEDSVWIDPENPFRLWVDWRASTPGDYVRVFTARSPGV